MKATEWSLRLADFSYTEDGNPVIFSGPHSWGRGDVTVNVTRKEVNNGYEFFDGLRDGKAAIIAVPSDDGSGKVRQKGLWITEQDYDAHVRDMTVDVTEEGLAIIKGEAWATMEIRKPESR